MTAPVSTRQPQELVRSKRVPVEVKYQPDPARRALLEALMAEARRELNEKAAAK
ncbi:hypothetical protein [Deinococcus ruber]|uniref:Uncharacterized protein n=1 Tax=Deinococcus ruber TaxID=1848197 RepID=A0A918C1C2_9DEIO|nr:hypothetical protein [Deinococcus ruber]GGR00082.1 hypothetical protein GCM10008957_10970 [Deinococcus ruber]